VTVKDGIVTLAGAVDSYSERYHACPPPSASPVSRH
jgi:hypothetical protein